MVYSSYKKQRILHYKRLGCKSTTIVHILAKEGLDVKVSGVSRFIRKFKETGSIARRSGSGRPSKITPQVLTIVERQMQLDDETTAVQLQKLLVDSRHPLSLKTILASRRKLGWTFRGSAYCQLIREANKIKRLEWAKANVSAALSNGFKDVLYTDESSIQLECHRRFACRKKGTQARPKPRAKHPCKVDVWAGISWKGPTPIVIFEGMMNAPGYIEVLESGLLPYIANVDSCPRFMQDNDPKHTSGLVGKWLVDSGINWWKTPAESPDLNPIENVWHELKEYLRRVVKPTTKDRLISGIKEFWGTVDIDKCKKYIGHLKKVVPRVIELDGGPTGY